MNRKLALGALLALVLVACGKSEEEWVTELRSPNAHTRLLASAALGSDKLELRDPARALSELRERTNIDPSRRVRAQARRSLIRKQGDSLDALLAGVCGEQSDADAARQLLAQGEEGARALGNSLRGGACGNKEFVARVLAAFPPEIALPQLLTSLKVESRRVRSAALGALRHMGRDAESLAPALEKLRELVGEDEELRQEVDRTLAAVRGE